LFHVEHFIRPNPNPCSTWNILNIPELHDKLAAHRILRTRRATQVLMLPLPFHAPTSLPLADRDRHRRDLYRLRLGRERAHTDAESLLYAGRSFAGDCCGAREDSFIWAGAVAARN